MWQRNLCATIIYNFLCNLCATIIYNYYLQFYVQLLKVVSGIGCQRGSKLTFLMPNSYGLRSLQLPNIRP